MPELHRQPTCRDCPWRVNSNRFIWPVEHFYDLRLEVLQPAQQNMPCQQFNEHATMTCQGFREVTKTLHLRTWLARARGETNPGIAQGSQLFPSFEAMADANGAGLFDWTHQLEPGDAVVHFKYGLAKTMLEVTRLHDGIVQASANGTTYRFNCLGYELQTVIDSRILPATPVSLKRI
jgi:hypothetical protein